MDTPNEIEGALDALDQALSDEDREAIRAMTDEHDFVVRAQFGLGMFVRNNMGLWGANRLKKVFLDAGIWQPDSMSSVILHAYYRRLHGKPIDLAELLADSRRAEDEWTL